MPDKDNFTCVLQPFGISSKDSNAMKSDNPHSGIYEAETARTLDGNGGNPSCNQGGIAVVESYAIQGSMIGREDKNGPQGDGINEVFRSRSIPWTDTPSMPLPPAAIRR